MPDDRTTLVQHPALAGEAAWAVPALLLTLASLGFVASFVPASSGLALALGLLPLWMIAAAGMLGVHAFWSILRMMRAGVDRPGRHIAAFVRDDWRRLLFVALFVALAGANMIAFMWAKPLLNMLVPFSADPMLADLDRLLFAGHDPWTLLQWLNSDLTSIFYHRGWFAMMILVLLLVLMQPPGARKSAVLLTYFLLWSLAGPLVHLALPAAGPVFFAQVGHGDRFAAIASPANVQQAADYLWRTYAARGFGPGAGISAMPSLHIATTAWMIVAVANFARRWLALVAVLGGLIFLLSISLGWHYAVDGLVGAALALGIYAAALFAVLQPRRRATPLLDRPPQGPEMVA